MQIQEIIRHLEAQGSWVDWDQTRDYILYGAKEREVNRVGVCWVATMQAIRQAVQQDIHFIISHENPFYQASTAPKRLIRESTERKQALLEQGDITLYRSHDLWDKMPVYGVADQWAARLGFTFQREVNSYLQFAEVPPMTVEALARRVAKALGQDGENGLWVSGDLSRTVRHVSMGTGAATDIFAMLRRPTDVVIVSDDGITNYCEVQYALDNDLPMIVVNHGGCEICGLKGMQAYLSQQFPELETVYLEEGYRFQYLVE